MTGELTTHHDVPDDHDGTHGGRSVVTMQDVARAAGVSVTTVSHVMNGTRHVRPTTKRAVQNAIASTGYVTDSIARSLRTGSTMVIGFAASAITNPYFGELVHAVEKRVTAHGYGLLLADTHDDPEREFAAVNALMRNRPDAVILAPSAEPGHSLDYLLGRRTPTVCIDRVPAPDTYPLVDGVGSENVEAMADLVEHLITRAGHRRIGLISGRAGLATTRERVVGFELGLRRASLPVDKRLIVSGDSNDLAATAALNQLMSLDSPPSAVVSANNLMTIGVLRAVSQWKLRIPDDVAIAAFDDFSWADAVTPALTAVAQPIDQIAATAVNLLLTRLADPLRPARRERLPAHLMHRHSCGCPPTTN